MTSGFDDMNEGGGRQGSEADVDALLRREFEQAFVAPEYPVEALNALRPSFRRAHTIHQLRQVAAVAAGVLIVVVGISAVSRLMPSDETNLTAAGEVDVGGDDDAPSSIDEDHELQVSGTTTTVLDPEREDTTNTTETTTTDETDGTDPNSSDPATTSATSATTASTVTTTRSSRATTGGGTSPTTDPKHPTSIRPDGSIAVITECGRIIVGRTGSGLELIELQPDPGFRTDVKEASSQRIEVSLEREHQHCEVKIRPSATGLDIDSRTEGEGEDDKG